MYKGERWPREAPPHARRPHAGRDAIDDGVSALIGVIRDGDDGVLRSGASCPIRVGLLISCSQRSSLARRSTGAGLA